MNYEFEGGLTPQGQSRYDGYMANDAGTPDIPQGPFGRAPQRPEFTPQPGQSLYPEPAPWMDDHARSLLENARNGTETAEAGANHTLNTDSREALRNHLMEKADKDTTSTTREQLTKLVEDIFKKDNPVEVAVEATKMYALAKILNGALKDHKEFTGKHIFDRAKQLNDTVLAAKGNPQKILDTRGEISSLAKDMQNYFTREQLVGKDVDPLKQIVSFEELMVKLADLEDNAEYKPGGKFELISVEETIDEFGRKMVTEKARPEHFARWIRDKMYFWDDFNPLSEVDFFKVIFIPTAYRTIGLEEILLSVPAYMTHRVPKVAELEVTQEEAERAKERGTAIAIKVKYPIEDPQNPGKTIEKEIEEYAFLDENGKVFARTNSKFAREQRQRTGIDVLFPVEYTEDTDGHKKGDAVMEETTNKEDWNTEKKDEFEEVKWQMMYEAWLETENHKNHVTYYLKGMPNEKPLGEALAQIYGTNILTASTKSRLIRLLNMASTKEMPDQLEGKLGHQGAVGKGMQRLITMYYHLAESNADADGWKIDGPNPFFELSRAKNGEYGSDAFYWSLIRQTFEGNFQFGEEYGSYHDMVLAAIDLAKEINTTHVPEEPGSEKRRSLEDFEKINILDLVLKDQSQILQRLGESGITKDDYDRSVAKVKKDWEDLKEKGKLSQADVDKRNVQLETIGQKDAMATFLNKVAEEKGPIFDVGKDQKDHLAAIVKTYLDGITKANGNSVALRKNLARFGVKFFTSAFDKGYVPNANIYQRIDYDRMAIDRVRQAMMDVLVKTEHLDTLESRYAEMWAYNMTYYTGIGARNDMEGIGHDAWSKILNTEYYRLRQTSGGNYPGNLDNLYGIHRLGVDFWQGIKAQGYGDDATGTMNRNLYQIMTGLHSEGGQPVFDINKDVGQFFIYNNAMRQFYADHVDHVINLFIDITKKHDFNFDKVVSEDNLGRVVINHAEMEKMINETWKHFRYGFDNRAFLYDTPNYGWWQDERMDENGVVRRTPHFGMKTLRDLMFSDEVQSLNMYNRKDVSSWQNSTYANKAGRDVFAYIIAMQLKEHVNRKDRAIIYSADQVALIANAFITYAARVMQGEHGEAVVLSGFFTPEEMMRILVIAHAILWRLYAKEYAGDAMGGFFSAILQMMSIVMKEAGAGITLGK